MRAISLSAPHSPLIGACRPISHLRYGLTFTLGRGNEVICKMCESMEHLVVGKDLDRDILSDMMGYYRSLTQDGQIRWIGPEKGVLAMATGAILNGVWDMWSRRAGKPLWEFVCEMEPEVLVELIDFKHMSDVVTQEEGLAFLKKQRPGWQERVALMKKDGFPASAFVVFPAQFSFETGMAHCTVPIGVFNRTPLVTGFGDLTTGSVHGVPRYTTSAGWLGYPEDKIRTLCKEYLAQGHRYFKMKVGSEDPEEDLMRARAIREEIGDDNYLMMDVRTFHSHLFPACCWCPPPIYTHTHTYTRTHIHCPPCGHAHTHTRTHPARRTDTHTHTHAHTHTHTHTHTGQPEVGCARGHREDESACCL